MKNVTIKLANGDVCEIDEISVSAPCEVIKRLMEALKWS